MPVELRKRRDLSRVNTRSELRYWCGRFVCSEEELKEAVAQVGVSVAKVQRYLDERRQRTEARRPVVRAR